ncbi:MAG: hypothetical protein AAB545_01965 [Patescibacteria group bacterium]
MKIALVVIPLFFLCLVWGLWEYRKRIQLQKQNAELAEICKVLHKILVYGEGKESDPFLLLTPKERTLYDEFRKTHVMVNIIGMGGRRFQIPIGFADELRKMTS